MVLEKVPCPSCDGSGTTRCPKCKGTGYSGNDEPVKCTKCGRGDGVIPCGQCNGTGMIEIER